MKKIFYGIISLLFFLVINACSSNPEPQFRIKNEQPNTVNVKVLITGNNKVSTYEIESGQSTSYQTAIIGNITATSVTQNESVSFLAEKNKRYTIVINVGNPPTIQIDR